MKYEPTKLQDLLEDYEDGDMGQDYESELKDELLKLGAALHNNGTEEGNLYQLMVVSVNPGEELPKPFTTMTTVGALSGKTENVKVMEIKEVRWTKDSRLVVEFLGLKM